MDFFHSGDLGDVIYALPVIRAMGGGRLFLHDEPGVETTHRMSVERVKLIGKLLVQQEYIMGVAPIFPPGEAINLNKFRTSRLDFHNGWLPEVQAKTWGFTRSIVSTPWLESPSGNMGGVVFARSSRYHNPEFPWRDVLKKYRDEAVFVGTPDEYTEFINEFKFYIPYIQTDTLLDVASVISECTLFVGNQSCPLAIAEGLKKRIVCEVCPTCPNCISPRPDFTAGWDADVVLPEL